MLGRLFESTLEQLPIGRLCRLAGAGLIAPCYHVAGDEPLPHVRHLYPHRTLRQFEAELDFLLGRFWPVSLADLAAAAASGQALPKNAFFLSFDDGFREMAEGVAPLCRRKGVPAAFFLTTGFLDNRMLGYRHKASLLIERCQALGLGRALPVLEAVWRQAGLDPDAVVDPRASLLSVSWRQSGVLDACAVALEVDFDAYLRDARPYLTCDQAAQMARDGFALGGHSVDHPRYAELSLDEQLDQTRRCMEYLKIRFPGGPAAFAFPFVSDGVTRAFYTAVFGERTADLVFCIGEAPAGDSRCVTRFGVERSSNESLETLLRAELAHRVKARLRSGWLLNESHPPAPEIIHHGPGSLRA